MLNTVTRVKPWTKAITFLALVSAFSVAAHLVKPSSWSPLAIDILHSLHGPGFALLAVIILCYFQYQCRSNINYVLAAGITMGIGLLSEIAQIPGPRDAQVKDIAVDALAIFGAIGVSALLDRNIRTIFPRRIKVVLAAAAGAAIAVACLPTIGLGHALIQQNHAFPVLMTFEKRWETLTFGQSRENWPTLIAAPKDWPSDGPVVAHAPERGRWGIFFSLHPLPDWQGYKKLGFLAASVSDNFRMTVCIREADIDSEKLGNQYCKSVQIGPVPQQYSLMLSDIFAGSEKQALDSLRIKSVGFSAAKPGSGREILLDDIRLEK